MIALIRLTEARKPVCVPHPVKVSAVNDGTAQGGTVPVHVFGRGMGNDIGAEFKGTAVDRRCKGVVDNQGTAVPVRCRGKLFNVKHGQCGIGNGFTENRFGIWTEGSIQLFIRYIRRDKCDVDAHAFHCDGNQVVGAAVNAGFSDNMITAAAEIEQREKIGSLSGTGQHGGRSAFQRADFCRDQIAGRILQTRVKIAFCLEIKEFSHVLAGFIPECRGLDDRDLTGLAVSRGITALNTDG